jgi:hypothetical protein|tara:strand:+ start:590 stop:736 length:147 start_codon:yes stop_codon:yes gene_type:complete
MFPVDAGAPIDKKRILSGDAMSGTQNVIPSFLRMVVFGKGDILTAYDS